MNAHSSLPAGSCDQSCDIERITRQMLARFEMLGRLWQNDSDYLLAREHDTKLTGSEAWAWATRLAGEATRSAGTAGPVDVGHRT